MLTLFTIPKAFKGNTGIQQINAIKSWTLLKPECEIILMGKDEGTAEAAKRLGVKHIADIECNEYGTPLLSSAFKMADNIAKFPVVGFINTDIILMSDFVPALTQVQMNKFLMVGLRWDMVLDEAIDFADAEWEHKLRGRLTKTGKLHNVGGGGDYFIYPKGMFGEIPPFAVGRTIWDNWLIYRARELGANVIDATHAFTNIHENHDYSHHPGGTAGVWQGPEAQRNVYLTGGLDHAFTTEHATHVLLPNGLKPALSPRRIYFRMRAFPVLYKSFRFFLPMFKGFEKMWMASKQS